MKELTKYINRNGVEFTLAIEKACVPAHADYWAFSIEVTEIGRGLSRVYAAMISRDLCDTEELAENFISQKPLAYLKSAYLDNYEDGGHLLLWPDCTAGWVVI